MPINGPAIVARLRAPEMIGPVASAFLFDRNTAQSAVSAALRHCSGGAGGRDIVERTDRYAAHERTIDLSARAMTQPAGRSERDRRTATTETRT